MTRGDACLHHIATDCGGQRGAHRDLPRLPVRADCERGDRSQHRAAGTALALASPDGALRERGIVARRRLAGRPRERCVVGPWLAPVGHHSFRRA